MRKQKITLNTLLQKSPQEEPVDLKIDLGGISVEWDTVDLLKEAIQTGRVASLEVSRYESSFWGVPKLGSSPLVLDLLSDIAPEKSKLHTLTLDKYDAETLCKKVEDPQYLFCTVNRLQIQTLRLKNWDDLGTDVTLNEIIKDALKSTSSVQALEIVGANPVRSLGSCLYPSCSIVSVKMIIGFFKPEDIVEYANKYPSLAKITLTFDKSLSFKKPYNRCAERLLGLVKKGSILNPIWIETGVNEIDPELEEWYRYAGSGKPAREIPRPSLAAAAAKKGD